MQMPELKTLGGRSFRGWWLGLRIGVSSPCNRLATACKRHVKPGNMDPYTSIFDGARDTNRREQPGNPVRTQDVPWCPNALGCSMPASTWTLYQTGSVVDANSASVTVSEWTEQPRSAQGPRRQTRSVESPSRWWTVSFLRNISPGLCSFFRPDVGGNPVHTNGQVTRGILFRWEIRDHFEIPVQSLQLVG